MDELNVELYRLEKDTERTLPDGRSVTIPYAYYFRSMIDGEEYRSMEVTDFPPHDHEMYEELLETVRNDMQEATE